MITLAVLTTTVIITVGAIICTSDEGNFATSVPARYDYEKHIRDAAEIKKLINKIA